MHQCTDTEPLLEECDDVFEGLGKLNRKCHIITDLSIRPVVHPPWSLPVAMTEWVQRKFEEMEAVNIIKQVDQPTDWVSSILVVSKPSTEAEGETLYLFGSQGSESCHKAWTFSNTPKMEEIVTRLNRTKQFSVFDASNGFWQGELDNESSTFTTFNIPLGRYRWKWMPFVINSAWKFGSAKWESTLRGFTE